MSDAELRGQRLPPACTLPASTHPFLSQIQGWPNPVPGSRDPTLAPIHQGPELWGETPGAQVRGVATARGAVLRSGGASGTPQD